MLVAQRKRKWEHLSCKIMQRDAWISHGWKPVPAKECSPGGWDSINVRYAECYGESQWSGKSNQPIETKSQDVFKSEEDLLKLNDGAPKTSATETRKGLSTNGLVVKALQYNEKFKKEPPHEWAVVLGRHVKHGIPNSLQFGACNAILSSGLWFTEAHIEIGGDDSIAHVNREKKMFFF